MELPSFHEITHKALKTFRRFPIAISWAITGSLFCIAIVQVNDNLLFDRYVNSVFTFVLGISWLIGTRFFLESRKNPEKWQFLKLVVVFLLILFYLHLPPGETGVTNPTHITRFFLYLLAGQLFVLFAPSLLQWNHSGYWNYLKASCIALGRSALFSGVLYLGLVLALLSISALFDVKIHEKRYGQLFIFCLGIVNTWIYLSDFPENVLEKQTIIYNKVLEVFVTYILIPLVIVYLLILYAYTLKIIWSWDLPQGWVSYLVIALAFLGFLIQAMIHPVRYSIRSWTINRFNPWFYVLLIPMIVLLFVAIFKRISEYGITENRYFVLLLAFWITAMTLYLLVSREKRLQILPLTLFALAMLSSIGPWGAFKISQSSQVARFRSVLEQVESNGNIATGTQFLQLTSIVTYLGERNAVSRLDAITGLEMQGISKDTSAMAYPTFDFKAGQKLMDTLGITIDPEDSLETADVSYNYYTDWNKNLNYSMAGFTNFATISYPKPDHSPMKIGRFSVHLNSKSGYLYLYDGPEKDVVLKVPLKERMLALSRYGQNLQLAPEEDFILEAFGDSLDLKMILLDLNFTREGDSVQFNQFRALLFLKQL